MTPLRVGGFTPLSTTDWPGMLSAVVFCQGCPWRCRYCHNPGLISSQGEDEMRWEAVLKFLQRRRGLLDGVVFSGGEPTLQAALADAMREVRALGFRVGLHTAGIYPHRLQETLPLLDWIGFDLKAPFADYARITGVPGSGERARASLDLVLDSGIAHQLRTTVHPALLADEDVLTIANELAKRDVSAYVLQEFRSQGCTDGGLIQSLHRARPLSAVAEEVSRVLANCIAAPAESGQRMGR